MKEEKDTMKLQGAFLYMLRCYFNDPPDEYDTVEKIAVWFSGKETLDTITSACEQTKALLELKNLPLDEVISSANWHFDSEMDARKWLQEITNVLFNAIQAKKEKRTSWFKENYPAADEIFLQFYNKTSYAAIVTKTKGSNYREAKREIKTISRLEPFPIIELRHATDVEFSSPEEGKNWIDLLLQQI